MSVELGSVWTMSKSVEEKRWNCREKRHIMKKNAEWRDDGKRQKTKRTNIRGTKRKAIKTGYNEYRDNRAIKELAVQIQKLKSLVQKGETNIQSFLGAT